jgi:hypothetical protein
VADDPKSDTKEKDARWPFVFLYLFMWAGMLGMSFNGDPIKLEYSVAVVLGLLVIVGIVAALAIGRMKRLPLFRFGGEFPANIYGHIFILTGILFIGFLFFTGIIQVAVLTFDAPIFDHSCALPSQRDVALFVWDEMARGALKYFAKYVNLAADGCALAASNAAWIATQGVKYFTSIVLVWYAVSFVKAWYTRLQHGRAPGPAT